MAIIAPPDRVFPRFSALKYTKIAQSAAGDVEGGSALSLSFAIAQLIHDGEAANVTKAYKILQREEIESEPAPLPSGPFRVIVADPPWHYDKRDDDPSKRENIAYATMSIPEIKPLLPVPDVQL